MMAAQGDTFWIDSRYQPLMRELGIDAQGIWSHPSIVAWRSIPERENCILDARVDGRPVRLHIKRYRPVRGRLTPAEEEVAGHRLLLDHDIPTAELVGWGTMADGRSFIIVEDLSGYADCEKLVAGGLPFDRLLQATAMLAAKLHAAGLHHRDLYLCHFFAKAQNPHPDPLPEYRERGKERGVDVSSTGFQPVPARGGAEQDRGAGVGSTGFQPVAVSARTGKECGVDVRLIDPARVRLLPRWLFRRRWIVKDLAQFWYSTLSLGVSDEQRLAWMACYGRQRGIADAAALTRKVRRKSDWIARHDRKLRARQPGRNVSIPPG
jgi:hypothetical protein